jgi:Tfp pilus assembly protein PilF
VIHNNLGAAYIQKGERQLAFLEFEAAAKLDPDYGSAHLNLGNWYLEESNPKKAITHYERAVELLPDDPRAHYHLAIAYGITGRERAATAELYRALSADSTFLPAKELLEKVGGQ